jgi:hypothetical protein
MIMLVATATTFIVLPQQLIYEGPHAIEHIDASPSPVGSLAQRKSHQHEREDEQA